MNPTGAFELGGPHADCGLTGRKIIVDTYGGMARHGGGAFSGKDPTKVDRSAAYAVRHVAKNVVAAGIATRCEVQVAYAIGVSHPVSMMVETFGTSEIDPQKLPGLLREHFDLRPAAIIERLDLRRPIFRNTAAYGHFGRSDRDFTWERTDAAAELGRPPRRSRKRATDVRALASARTRASVAFSPTFLPSTARSTTRCPTRSRATCASARSCASRSTVGACAAGCSTPTSRAPEVDRARLRAVIAVVSAGPPADVVDLCRWAAWRWAGPLATFLRAASPANVVPADAEPELETAVYPPSLGGARHAAR